MVDKLYCGIDNDAFGGMTPVGKIIRDAWVFGILPEDETCENWSHGRLQILHDQTKAEWDKYQCLVSNLTDELKQRHTRIYQEALQTARSMGWDPDQILADDD